MHAAIFKSSISPLQQQQQQQQRGFTWIQILKVFVLSRASNQIHLVLITSLTVEVENTSHFIFLSFVCD